MEYRDRKGNTICANDGQDALLKKMYETALGRMILKPLVSPAVSRLGGWALNTRLSSLSVKPFVRSNKIDLSQYEKQEFLSYNDFFCRNIRQEERPVDMCPEVFVSPCDSKLSAYPIEEGGRFEIKHTSYTVESLLQNTKLAKRFYGGQIFIFRLTVDDYHHYCYVDAGRASKTVRIPGVFHTVNPVANEVYPIYKENTREYSLLQSEHFGTLLMMEVGALMVGKIVNDCHSEQVTKGQEKGHFEFGGSTVILCTQKDKVILDEDILQNTADGIETIVKMGEKIGELSEKA